MKYILTLTALFAIGCCTCTDKPTHNNGPADFLRPIDIDDRYHLLHVNQQLACAGCRERPVNPLETKLPDNWYEHNVG